jgi:hypothetical protein
LNPLPFSLVAFSVAATQALAAPSVGAMTDTDLSSQEFCQFRTTSSSASVVLGLRYREAKMRLDGNLVRLQVKEATCLLRIT